MWVPGNHEFNYGMDVLRDVIAQHECNVLCSNVYNSDGSRIRNVMLSDGTPLDMNEKYEVAVNDYRVNSQLLVYDVIFSEEDGLPELVESDIRGLA